MKSARAGRERELEANIALREREIAALEQEKSELQSCMAAEKSEMREDELLASFPVLAYCGKKPRQSIKHISLEQYGNVMIQLEIAKKAIDANNQKDRVDIQELNRLIREQEKKQKEFVNKAMSISEKAGLNIKLLTKQKQSRALKLQSYTSNVSVAELEARKRLIEHEVKAAKIITEKKSASILALTKLLEKRRSTIDEVDSLYNQIRIVDRDTTIAGEELTRMKADMEAADAWLESRPDPSDSVARKLIDEDSAAIHGEKEQAMNEQRVPQERVIKAQEFRIAQLEKRAKVVDKALEKCGLSREVDKIVAREWSRREVEVPEHQEELYDIEKIIPAQEKIHPGIYNLLLTEKERAGRTVSILTISAKEKEEVIAALTPQLEQLAAECNGAIQELDDYASKLVVFEEKQRLQALKWVREQRQYCAGLLEEKAVLVNTAE